MNAYKMYRVCTFCTEPVHFVQSLYILYAVMVLGHQASSECFLAAAGGLEVRVQLTKALPQHLREEKIPRPGRYLAQSTV